MLIVTSAQPSIAFWIGLKLNTSSPKNRKLATFAPSICMNFRTFAARFTRHVFGCSQIWAYTHFRALYRADNLFDLKLELISLFVRSSTTHQIMAHRRCLAQVQQTLFIKLTHTHTHMPKLTRIRLHSKSCVANGTVHARTHLFIRKKCVHAPHIKHTDTVRFR